MIKPKKEPENRFSPLPKYLENYRNDISNFGLYFKKFGKYHQDNNELKTQHSWNNGQRGRQRIDYEWLLVQNQFDHYDKHYPSAALEKIHNHQKEYLLAFSTLCTDNNSVIELTAKTESRFLTGIGETSPTEVGMVFDRNTGNPFIPASSIKGAVRYVYCIKYIEKNPDIIKSGKNENEKFIEEKDVQGLLELFGSLDTKNSSRGGFAFMDCYPEKSPKLAIDIMNPHHGNYYKDKSPEGPVEIEAPIPIKFLTVKKEETFKFRGYFIKKDAQKYRKQLIEAFTAVLTQFGLGAKTAVGYGKFQKNIEDTVEIMLREEKKNAEIMLQEEKDKAEIMLKEEYERLHPWCNFINHIKKKKINNWGEFIEHIVKYEDKKEWNSYKNIEDWKEKKDVAIMVKEIAFSLRKNKPKKWDDKRDEIVADWLKKSGETWDSKKKETTDDINRDLNNDSQILTKIEKLTDFKSFIDSKIKIKTLDKQSAEELKKMMNKWGLKNSKKGSSEKKAFDNLVKRLKHLKKIS